MRSISITGQTDVGKRRKDNQDTFICTPIWSDTSALLAVIDGVGGYAGGDLAAAIAKESIEQYMNTPSGDPLSMLREAVVFANNQIHAQRQQHPQRAQMACVLTTAVVDSRLQKVFYVHVGDTRLYRFRQGRLEKLTRDHSMVGIREDANELTETEAMQHPRRNEILRDLGSAVHRVDDPDFLDAGETGFEPGDQLLLCSDGLTDMITQARITEVLASNLSLEARATELIRLANTQGGNDNITVVLAQDTMPPNQSAPVTTGAVGKPEEQTTTPVSSATGETAATRTQPARRRSSGLWIFLSLLLLGTVGGLVWYQYQPSSLNDERPADSLQASATRTGFLPERLSPLDSLVERAYRSADHQLTLSMDTVRLDKPLVLTDSLLRIVGQNRLTVFLPADTNRAPVALRTAHTGPVHLENIVISGFKTGIETTSTTPIQLSNVYFQEVKQPINVVIRQDTFRNTLFEVSIQNRPTSQPLRP
ncbi:PP2C family protein-serine/threonine phosphatase [Larkinella bovis]|uniref:PP2C family protein-serine/threonine phosphatase n=1 Tax=Larkinella bovis TaxID=683041 RepID=A0ABW0IJN1_9BACT